MGIVKAMQVLVNDEPHNLFELRYFDQSVKLFITGSNWFDTLIGKSQPLYIKSPVDKAMNG